MLLFTGGSIGVAGLGIGEWIKDQQEDAHKIEGAVLYGHRCPPERSLLLLL